MVDIYDHRYVRICHTTVGSGTKLKGEHWLDPHKYEQPTCFEACEPVVGLEQEPHYEADVYYDFWDVRCVLPVNTMTKDTDFEVRKFTLRVPRQTFSNWHQWMNQNENTPVVSDIGDEHLVAQFVVAATCKPEDLCRQHLDLLSQMREHADIEEAKAPWVKSRQPRSDYVQAFLRRVRTIVDNDVPERSCQPEENPHMKPKTRKGKAKNK